MTEEPAVVIPREGEISVRPDDTAEETAAASQAGKDNQGADTPSAEGDNTRTQSEETPFHEHPRWRERESEWNVRFNDQERRHQEELRIFLESKNPSKTEQSSTSKPPVWFGGSQEQWDAYQADLSAHLKETEERAEKRVIEKFSSQQSQEEKAVKDATDYLTAEIATIEGDKTLNPTGDKVDAKELFKVVFDNQLIDAQGRWNYKAGYRLMKAEAATAKSPAPKPNTEEKKKAAAATTSETRGEAPAKTFTTSKDFEKSRPW